MAAIHPDFLRHYNLLIWSSSYARAAYSIPQFYTV